MRSLRTCIRAVGLLLWVVGVGLGGWVVLEVSSWDLEFLEGSDLSLPSLLCDAGFSDGHSL